MYQVFTLGMIGEKLSEEDKVGYVCFIDLQKPGYVGGS